MKPNEIKRCVKLQKSFTKMYSRTGMIAVSQSGVQMRITDLRPIIAGAGAVCVEDRGGLECPVRFAVDIDGVSFFALADFEDVLSLGLGSFMDATPRLQKEYGLFLDNFDPELPILSEFVVGC